MSRYPSDDVQDVSGCRLDDDGNVPRLPHLHQAALSAAALHLIQEDPARPSVVQGYTMPDNAHYSANEWVAQAAPEVAFNPGSNREHAEQLRRRAARLVAQATLTSVPAWPTPSARGATMGRVTPLDTSPVGRAFYTEAFGDDGIVVVKLFGGMCAGLDCALQSGY